MQPSTALGFKSHLPIARTPIVGREREIDSLRQLLLRPGIPLITLIGPGGVGKTRLATELAIESLGRFRDGVVFVDLSEVEDPALLGAAILQSAGVVPNHGESTDETVRRSFSDKELLLILDNFEQIVDGAAVVSGLLGWSPGVRVLTTSRSPLRIHGEHEFPVKPLGFATKPNADEIGAITLFANRASAVNPDFALTPENFDTIRTICMKLDGLPLAIELAAARLRLLTPSMLLTRLEGGLEILTSGPRDSPVRQQTLTNAISWSYGLLSAEEQWTFRHLSVFAGGFDLETATELVERMNEANLTEIGSELRVFDSISALIDQSLLRRIELVDGMPRVTMLNTIREFARAELDRLGETSDARRAHATYYAEALSVAYGTLKGPQAVSSMAWASREMDNLRAAALTILDLGHKELALNYISELTSFWEGRIALREFSSWLDRAFELPGELSPDAELSGMFVQAWTRTFQGDHFGAKPFATRALELARQTQSANKIAKAHNLLGGISVHESNLDRAWDEFSKALELTEEDTDISYVQSLLHNLGIVAMLRGDMEQAWKLSLRALSRARERGDPIGEARVLLRLSQLAIDGGDIRIGAEYNRTGLRVLWDARYLIGVSEAISTEAVIADCTGETAEADRLMCFAKSIEESNSGVDIEFSVSTPFIDRYKAIEGRIGGRLTRSPTMPETTDIAELVQSILARELPVSNGNMPSRRGQAGDTELGLTVREREIVRLLARGRSNQEIADELFISLRTAQTHVSNILNKLKLPSRAAAAAYAVRHGIE